MERGEYHLIAEYFDKIELWHDEPEGKTSISTRDPKFKNIVKHVPLLNRLILLTSSESFFQEVLSSVLPEEARNYRLFTKNPLWNFINFLKNKKIIRINHQLSLMPRGSLISPHTDRIGKLLSICCYFPDLSQEGRSDLGTVFHEFGVNQYKYFNLENRNLREGLESFPNFNDEVIEAYRASFDPGEMCGFVKNEYSWHSVDIVSTDKRRSMNINFVEVSIWRELRNKVGAGGKWSKLRKKLAY